MLACSKKKILKRQLIVTIKPTPEVIVANIAPAKTNSRLTIKENNKGIVSINFSKNAFSISLNSKITKPKIIELTVKIPLIIVGLISLVKLPLKYKKLIVGNEIAIIKTIQIRNKTNFR